MDDFCRKFLSGDVNYEPLYEILSDYTGAYEQMDSCVFRDRESFQKGFKTICYTVIDTRGCGKPYILAILGWAVHVDKYYNAMEWYDSEILVTVLY